MKAKVTYHNPISGGCLLRLREQACLYGRCRESMELRVKVMDELAEVNEMSKKVLMTDGGATVEQREDLIESIEKFLDAGGSPKFKVVAAMDVNLEIDDVLIGSNVRVGRYEFEFTRDRYVQLGEYYIMQKG